MEAKLGHNWFERRGRPIKRKL